MPEIIESAMPTSSSIPTSIYDCTDDSRASYELATGESTMPLSPTLPHLKSESLERESPKGSVRLPVEYSTLPSDGQDLLVRLLEFNPERRIRSIFALQRIAFFMGFNLDDARKKKVHNFC